MRKGLPCLIDIFFTLISLIIAYWLHNNSFIHGDVAWHIVGAKRLLENGHYLTTLFDDNAPFVFAYYIPLIYLQKLLPTASTTLIYGYILVNCLISLFLCHFIINKAYGKNTLGRHILYFTVVFIVLFLPTYTLGQREIVLINLFLPYYLIALFSLDKNSNSLVSNRIAIICAVLAAFAISQNILYIFIPLFIDSFRYYKTKKIYSSQIVFYAVFCALISLVIPFYPEYIKPLIPMVLCYESGFNVPFYLLILRLEVFISLFAISLLFIMDKYLIKPGDLTLCAGVIVLTFLIYFFEKKIWDSHLYPTLAFVTLFLGVLITKYLKNNFSKKPSSNIFILCSVLSMMITIICMVISSGRQEVAEFHDVNGDMNQWLQYAKHNFLHKKLFFFTIHLAPSYTLAIYTHVKIVSPWSNVWFLPHFIREKKALYFCNPAHDIQLINQMVADSLNKYQPDFLIIEKAPQNLRGNAPSLDYPSFFSQYILADNPLKNYYLYGHFGQLEIYTHRTENGNKME